MLRRLTYLLGLVIFHVLFWKESMGLNLVLFSAAIILFLRKFTSVPLKEWLYLGPFIASCIGSLFIHSSFSMWGMYLTTIAYTGYIANREFSVIENFTNSFVSFFRLRDWEISLPERYGVVPRPIPFARALSIGFIPLVIFVFFYSFFVRANPVFEELHERSFANFFSFLNDINFVWLFFIMLGVFIIRWGMLKTRPAALKFNPSDQLDRKGKRTRGTVSDLKREYYIALLVFASLNALFFVVNVIDVNWVWFQFHVSNQFSLKEFVYSGVGWLIAITLISAGMLLYFFRGSLNFYPNNKWLKRLAVIWTIQNIILALSVSIRTIHYINFHGLAPLRLGVLLFTIIIATALSAVIFKINNTHTTALVTRITSSFAIVLLGVCALIPWNTWIANHNLNHEIANEVDADYYLNLGPEAYPILYANLDVIEQQYEAHSSNKVIWLNHNFKSFKSRLDMNAEVFVENYRRHASWQSWSPARKSAYTSLVEILENQVQDDEERVALSTH